MSLTRLKSVDEAVRWLRERVPAGATLRTDSRLVQPGDAFIAWPGHASDGRQYARAGLVAGASVCLVEHEGVRQFAFDGERIASLPALKAATGLIADAFFDHPSAQLEVVATTGTNGKTSTAWWTAQALTLLGRRCGVVGTLGIGEPPHGGVAGDAGNLVFNGLTTPDPVLLHAAMRRFADAGFAACALEASSIGLAEQRLAGLRITLAMFTNFTRDHLDYHGSMEAYWDAKRQLFAWPGLRAAVINLDDPQGPALADEAHRRGVAVWSHALRHPAARLQGRDLDYVDGGLAFEVVEAGRGVPVRSTLIGDYNAGNLLGVIAALRALNVSLADAAAVVPLLTPVPGRMQRVGAPAGQPEVVVDYAHTPDALEKSLLALRPFAAARGGALVCVFGCGGNRDATKRPLMGEIAAGLADRVVLTSDNPRGEAPERILEQIASGIGAGALPAVTTQADRRAAIAEAIAGAAPHDVLLIAGKGHEDYQDINGVKHPFSDAAVASAALQARAAA